MLFMVWPKEPTNCSNSSPLKAEALLTRTFRFPQDDGCELGRPQSAVTSAAASARSSLGA